MPTLRLPRPATVIALTAAVVASTGSAVAATKITSKQIKNGTIKLVDISRPAKKSLRSAKGPAGVPGPAGRSALGALRSGETIRGVWSMRGDPTDASAESVGVTFPIPAPTPVDSLHVVIAGQDAVAGDGCSGTAAAPVAGSGFVCLYFARVEGTTSAGGLGGLNVDSDLNHTGDGSRYGFAAFVVGGARWVASGTWAYTAP